jgi:hypothetical protein
MGENVFEKDTYDVSHIYPEVGGGTSFRNFGDYVPDYTVL